MDIKLNYMEQGSGFPLVLLHGNGGDHTYFEHQMAPFSAHYRVIAVDTRGHGESPRGEAPFTLEQFAQDLKDFLDELGIEKCHLLGFSDGGNIALLFALQYPQYIDKLILNGANLDPSGVKRTTQLPIELGWASLKVRSHFDPTAQPKLERMELMVHQPHISLLELRKLRLPTLVVAGDRDMIKEAHTRAISASIPTSRLSILPGTHFLARDQWEAFNALVLEFLAKG
ncbi:alpha/beta hydrolase [Flavonifractor sp. An100]|uniref:alpha/beta fold hydrolase n=1 Tax=Flavonifractor sp. An100 TaxID=1965538 RepID=UPI000B36C9BE|nr:alpha/beta hydrolase [Flavonifractor sp. An100]OUQ80221.1 alpha/beta hydrolase [Flavonifractor sp. An100]